MNLSPEQRARLLRTKLVALSRDLGMSPDDATDVGTSAAAVDGDRALVLIEQGDPGSLAGAMLWASRRGAGSLTVFVDHGAEDAARWAGYFEVGGGSVEVRRVEGATSRAVEPAPLPRPVAAPSAPPELLEVLGSAGVEVVVEDGQVRGEILGLEVARLVEWPVEVGGDGELHLEAGVGRFDRDAVAAARPDESPEDSLARTVAQVRTHRFPGAPVHPVQLLARERWLRSMVVADPSLVGASRLAPVDMTTAAQGLKDVHPAAAMGVDADGDAVVVVCSTGVDLALVPLAADTCAMHDSGARLVLAVPARDHHVATTTLVGLLRRPAELVDLEPGWG